MRKESKLREKPARLPDTGELERSGQIQDYLEEVARLNLETARCQRFLLLLRDLFGEAKAGFVEEYLQGMEKYVRVKQKDILLRGRIDTLYGNLVIEFEADLGKSLAEAKEQLRKYTACLWSEPAERTVNYLCLATDGIKFLVYSPKTQKPVGEPLHPEDIQLEEIERADFSRLDPYRIYFWLDRYFFRHTLLSPKTEEFVTDFGIRSHAFHSVIPSLSQTWQEVKGEGGFKVIYENWERYLRVTYGSLIGSEELFLRHSYLATLAKLIAWIRLSRGDSIPGDDEALAILNGEFFKKHGITNFLEEDFFSWIARGRAREVALDVSRKLLSLLLHYNLRELSEDILKSLYQELVDPQDRHDLGEYYTPDWLAQRMVEKALSYQPKASVLDPACGSGTFLYMTIKYKRKALGDSRETLDHILENTAGIDIHPLAVIIAKTNYLLALGDLLRKRRKSVTIPVYLADSIKPPEEKLPGFPVVIDDRQVFFPKELVENSALYDEAIQIAGDFAQSFAGREDGLEQSFNNFLKQRSPKIAADAKLRNIVRRLSLILKKTIEDKRDTIWAFILKNLYKPLFLKERFDIVLGNPPWLSYRYVEKGEYQDFLKEQIVNKHRLLRGRAELITHMELGTLFFLRVADLYLKSGGMIGFVLPRSIFTADQHDAFRRSSFSLQLGFTEVWDLEKVTPLFNVPACVFFARKGGSMAYPLSCELVSGELERRNASLIEAEPKLQINSQELSLIQKGSRSFLAPSLGTPTAGAASFYKPAFKQGATIVPRPFWFVDIVSHPALGFSLGAPYVSTAARAEEEAKPAYKGLHLEGNIERDFLYATLLSTDIVPFGHRDFRLVILPIKPTDSHYTLLTAEEARQSGFLYLAEWLERVEREWEKRRGEKAGRHSVYQWLDYRKKLSAQNRRAKYKVLYPMSATYLCACVVENEPIDICIAGQAVSLNGFIADYKAYYYETDSEEEAYYLTSILNSPTVDELVKPMQSRGQWGPRDICKKVLELPIPQHDPENEDHQALAQLGEAGAAKVESLLPPLTRYRSIGHIRKLIRDQLASELGEIDAIVGRIIGT